MKSKIIWETLIKEDVEKAETLGLKKPEPILEEGEIHFDVTYIHLAYLNKKGEIIIYLPSGHWILEYNKDLWDKIKEHLRIAK